MSYLFLDGEGRDMNVRVDNVGVEISIGNTKIKLNYSVYIALLEESETDLQK